MISQCVEIHKGELGYMIKGQPGKWWGTPPPARSKDDITGFSSASRRRLRETLAMARLSDGGRLFGVTFTIPSPTEADILTPDQVRRIWFEFITHVFPRKFKRSALIWRIELQVRGQAHWHCVFYAADADAADEWYQLDVGFGLLRSKLDDEWRGLVARMVDKSNWDLKTYQGFYCHGVQIKPLESSAIVGYVCDHESKSKQEQLGWVGRQWGIINRKNLTFEGSAVCSVPVDQHIKAARQFRRLQEHLRRDGVYTGVRVTPSANVSKSIFGKDADRLIKCYGLPL